MSIETIVIPKVLTPREASERSGISVASLVAFIRVHRYPFTELVPGGKPGDRGRGRWGLTLAQLAHIVDKQVRRFEPPATSPSEKPEPSLVSPDGKSRLRGGHRRRSGTL